MLRTLGCAVTCLLIATAIRADDLRCGSGLVESGDSIDDLMETCGDPVDKEETYMDLQRREW